MKEEGKKRGKIILEGSTLYRESKKEERGGRGKREEGEGSRRVIQSLIHI